MPNTIEGMETLRTASLMTALSAAEHCLGFLYRILLSRVLGSAGLGRYQMALAVFSVFATLSLSGLPVTLSRTLASHRARGNMRAARRAQSAAMLLSLGVSLFFTLALFALRPLVSPLFSDGGAEGLFYILLLCLPFTALYAVLRGGFWGEKRFFAYSFLELAEEIAMISFGVLMLVLFPLSLPKENLAAGAAMLSHLVSFGAALGCFLARGGRLGSPKGEIRPLVRAALPVTLVRALSTLAGTAVSFLFPLALTAAGATSSEAMAEYGIVTGMVMPVMHIPSAFLSSLALVLVPAFSEAAARGEKEKLAALTEKALNAALLVSGALLPLYAVCGRDIGILLFDSPKSGEMIAFGSLLLLPMSLTLISGSLLNSLHCERATLLIFAAGAGAMLLSVIFLTGTLSGGALLIGMGAEYALSAALSLFVLRKKTGRLRSKRYAVKVLLAAGMAAGAGYFVRRLAFLHLSFVPALIVTLLFAAGIEAGLFSLLKLCDFKALLGHVLPARRKRHQTAA